MRKNALDKKPVLVDTSVWIAYLKKQEPAYTHLNGLMESERVLLLGLVLAELYQGCKTEKEISVICDLSEVFPKIADSGKLWEEAGLLAFKSRRRGKTFSLSDCYIAVAGRHSGASLFSYDKHFAELAPCCRAPLYSPADE